VGQIQEWLVQRKVHKITLVITNVNTKEVLEKWDFKVDYEGQKTNGTDSNIKVDLPEMGTKDVKTIQKEIREVIRQITGNSYLCRDFEQIIFFFRAFLLCSICNTRYFYRYSKFFAPFGLFVFF